MDGDVGLLLGLLATVALGAWSVWCLDAGRRAARRGRRLARRVALAVALLAAVGAMLAA
jgi:hypothetical protein